MKTHVLIQGARRGVGGRLSVTETDLIALGQALLFEFGDKPRTDDLENSALSMMKECAQTPNATLRKVARARLRAPALELRNASRHPTVAGKGRRLVERGLSRRPNPDRKRKKEVKDAATRKEAAAAAMATDFESFPKPLQIVLQSIAAGDLTNEHVKLVPPPTFERPERKALRNFPVRSGPRPVALKSIVTRHLSKSIMRSANLETEEEDAGSDDLDLEGSESRGMFGPQGSGDDQAGNEGGDQVRNEVRQQLRKDDDEAATEGDDQS